MPAINHGIYGPIESVTEILAAAGLGPDLSSIPPGILEWARERGSAVHEAVGLYLSGDLDFSSLHPEVLPRVTAAAEWLDRHGFVPLSDIAHGLEDDEPTGGVEHPCMVIDETARVCGHLDLVGYVHPGDLVMIDLKSSLDRPSVTVQLAAYSFIFGRAHLDLKVDRYLALVLSGKGPAKAVAIDPKPAEAVWLAALEVARWKRMR